MDIFSLGSRDFINGLVMAILGASLDAIKQMLLNGFGGFDYKELLLVVAIATISYLSKNFATDKNTGKVLGKV